MLNSHLEFSLRALIQSLPQNKKHLVVKVIDEGEVAEELQISGARSLELAAASDLVFCKDVSSQLITLLSQSKSCFIVAPPQIQESITELDDHRRVFILSNKPRLLLALLLKPFDVVSTIYSQEKSIHPEANVASNVKFGPGVVIGSDVELGRNCVIGPNTVIDHATIGEATQIGFNCSIGGDGFGYEVDEETGEIVKFPQLGRVIIGNRVEMDANCGIARGSLRDTILEDDVKLDNLVHVAHNCHVKRGALLTANVMLSGSVTVGKYVWLGPSTSLMNGITVGDFAMTGLGAVVTKSVSPNELVAGVPARKLRDRYPSGFPLLMK